MALRLPSFDLPSLQQITVCGVVASADKALIEEFGGGRRLQARREIDRETMVVRMIVEAASEIHLHLEVARDGVWSDSHGWTEATFEELSRSAERFYGQVFEQSLVADYCVGADELPRHGLVDALRGVNAEMCGISMRMSGATFDIDDDLFTKVRWSIESAFDDAVALTLFAQASAEFNEGYLRSVEGLLEEGLDCFVFQKARTGRNVGDTSGTAAGKQGPCGSLRGAS